MKAIEQESADRERSSDLLQSQIQLHLAEQAVTHGSTSGKLYK